MSLFWELVVRFSVGSGQRRFTRFVALASLLGMMLGVAALITVLSVMNGFSGELHQRLLSVTPDMTVLPPDTSDENLSRWASLAIGQEGVTGATLFHSGTVLLRAGTRSRGIQLIGASRAGLSEVLDVGPHLVVGELVDLEVQPFTVVLGADLARLLRVDVGDSVEVLLPRLTVSPLGVFPRSRALRVVGLFAVGAPPDAQVAYVSQLTADKLLGRTGDRGVQLRLTDRSQVAMVSSAIASAIPTIETRDRNADRPLPGSKVCLSARCQRKDQGISSPPAALRSASFADPFWRQSPGRGSRQQRLYHDRAKSPSPITPARRYLGPDYLSVRPSLRRRVR